MQTFSVFILRRSHRTKAVAAEPQQKMQTYAHAQEISKNSPIFYKILNCCRYSIKFGCKRYRRSPKGHEVTSLNFLRIFPRNWLVVERRATAGAYSSYPPSWGRMTPTLKIATPYGAVLGHISEVLENWVLPHYRAHCTALRMKRENRKRTT